MACSRAIVCCCTPARCAGLDFDVGIGGSHALFKSTILGLLAQVRVGCWHAAEHGFCSRACPTAVVGAAVTDCRGPPHPLQFDWRFGALVRLIKLWARHHDVNDSTNGTLNSFALTLLVGFSPVAAALLGMPGSSWAPQLNWCFAAGLLLFSVVRLASPKPGTTSMGSPGTCTITPPVPPRPQVIFHLQTRTPAVLPPLCELFGAGPGDERPMQEQRFPDWHLLQVGGWGTGLQRALGSSSHLYRTRTPNCLFVKLASAECLYPFLPTPAAGLRPPVATEPAGRPWSSCRRRPWQQRDAA